MKKLRVIAVFCIVAVLLGGIGAYAATNYGTESDPLITLSYLNSVLKPQLEQTYNKQTSDSIAALESRLEAEAGGAYTSLTVKADQTLTCKAGCEFLVRSGEAYVTGGILNVTEGKELAAKDWLMKYHLYMSVSDTAAVRANSDVYLMIRGDYTVS
ncbi:MAG: hypothetical protein IJD81_06665 [Oscillospiraceae bacterium]|nr:hypothetical protein [Oscillospiraceae bacterium]